MYKLRINPVALQDLKDIKQYIASELDNPVAAKRIVNSIIQRYEALKKFPYMGERLNSKIEIQTDYRYLVSGSYIIFYRVEKRYVYVNRILYGARDYIKTIFGELE